MPSEYFFMDAFERQGRSRPTWTWTSRAVYRQAYKVRTIGSRS